MVPTGPSVSKILIHHVSGMLAVILCPLLTDSLCHLSGIFVSDVAEDSVLVKYLSVVCKRCNVGKVSGRTENENGRLHETVARETRR